MSPKYYDERYHFSLYINDLKDILSNFNGPEGILSDSVKHLLYADD